ncbi:MAG: hypothetical protein ACFNOP_05360 [Bacteroides sp.]
MKSMRITILLLMLSMGFASLAIAQEESVPEGATSPSSGRTCPLNVEFSGKLKSRHVWNGCLSTTAWNLQPDLTISAYGLFVNAWGLIPISKDFSTEIDFTLGYSIGPVTLMYTDFFYLSQDKYENLFRWRHEDLGALHQQLAQFHFNLGKLVEKVPLQLQVAMFTWGDYKKEVLRETDDNWKKGAKLRDSVLYDAHGKPQSQYSMYIGLSYSHTISTGQTLTYTIGGTPYAGFFAAKPYITNVKFQVDQPVQITDRFGLNLSGELICNPWRQNFYFVLGVGML